MFSTTKKKEILKKICSLVHHTVIFCDYGRLTNENFTSNPIVSLKQ